MKRVFVSLMPTGNEAKSSAGVIYAMVVLAIVLVLIVAAVSILDDDAAVQRIIVFIGTIIPVIFGFITVGGKITSLLDNNKQTQEQVSKLPDEISSRIDMLENKLVASDDRLTQLPCQLDTGVPGTEAAPFVGRHRRSEAV